MKKLLVSLLLLGIVISVIAMNLAQDEHTLRDLLSYEDCENAC